MNQPRKFPVRVCEKCTPPGWPVEFYEHNVMGIPRNTALWSLFPCERCGEKPVGDLAVLYYTVEDICKMTSDLWHNSRESNEMKTKIKILEKKTEILENHIRFQPNGDGAIEALEHWLSLADPDTDDDE